jgi:MFS family permease
MIEKLIYRFKTIRWDLALIFLIMLMDIIGLSVLFPVAALIVQRYSSLAVMVSLVTAIYAGAQFFAAPLMGKLGDRYGRRPVLLVSLVGQAAGYLLFGIGGSLWMLFLGRLIGGITSGNLSTATAYIADVSKPEDRAKNFTLIGMAWGLGLICGPALGGALSTFSLETPAFVAAGITMANVLLGIFLLPESLPRERRDTSPMRPEDYNPIVAIVEMWRKPGLGWLLLVLTLFNFAFNGINSIFSVFLIRKFLVGSDELGTLLVLGGIALAIVQFLLVRRVVPRFGEKNVGTFSLAGQALGALAVLFAPAFWMIYPINMLVSATSGFTFPTMTTLCTDRVPHREVGLLMGVTTALGSLMNIAGPLWAGVMFDKVSSGSPYWMSAVLFAVTALMLYKMPRREPVRE